MRLLASILLGNAAIVGFVLMIVGVPQESTYDPVRDSLTTELIASVERASQARVQTLIIIEGYVHEWNNHTEDLLEVPDGREGSS